MDNLIKEEAKKSEAYLFDTYRPTKKGGIPLVKLTRKNVALAEAMIKNDSDYIRSSDKNAEHTDKYPGSTAYWMTRLWDVLTQNESDDKIKECIIGAVRAVDRENSTHINSDKNGINELTERIFKHRKTLIDELKDREKGFKLIIELSEPTFDEPITEEHYSEFNGKTEEKTYYGRKNYSFATKFCHYACFFFFTEGQDQQYQDNYSIYDSILLKALPLYLSQAGINDDGKPYKKSSFNNAEKYKVYSDVIDKLRLKEDKISRNGFDHLIWYYHKAR